VLIVSGRLFAADIFEKVAFHEVRVPETRLNDLGVAAQQQREQDVPGSPPCKGLFYAERHGGNAFDDHRLDLFPIGEGKEMITGDIARSKPRWRERQEMKSGFWILRRLCAGHSCLPSAGPLRSLRGDRLKGSFCLATMHAFGQQAVREQAQYPGRGVVKE
jgi:hypothetical protein